MKQRTKKMKELRSILLFSILTIIVLQVAVTVFTVKVSDTGKRLDANAEEMLQNTVQVKSEHLEEQFLKWTNVDETLEELDHYAAEMETTYGEPASELMKSKEIRNEILEYSCNYLLNNLRSTGATGSFLILNQGTQENRKAALYLRDLNPESTPSNNYDILVEAGGGQQIMDRGFTLDTQWTMELPMEGDRDFYDKPMETAMQMEQPASRVCGYFSGAFRLSENDIEMITYTVPLLDQNQEPYAVLGVEINLEYLRNYIPGGDISLDKDAAFVIGILKEEGKVSRVLIDGSHFQARIGNDPITLNQISDKLYEAKFPKKDEKTLAYMDTMKMYDTNTPFESEQWVLLGLVHKEVLYQSSNRFKTALFTAIVFALGISIAGTFVVTYVLGKPIRILMKDVRIKGGSKMLLPKTGIREFDELAREIERLNERTFKEGSRVADIIEISNLPLGVFELEKKSDLIFCTKQVFTVLNIPLEHWENNYVKRESFEREMEQVRNKLIPDETEQDVYYFRINGMEKYIRFRSSGDEDRSIQIVMDITGEMIEKQIIKHDRDYDVLTNLYNRRAFSSEMQMLLETKDCSGAVLSVWDLDNLKYVNDNYGHDMGDKYIRLLAEVFLQNQKEDMLMARVSGDEFMIFSYLHDRSENSMRTYAVHRAFQKRKLILPDGSSFAVSVSAGLSQYGEDGITYAELVRYADFAMYEGKRSNKGEMRFFARDAYIKDYILTQGVGELNRILSEEDISYYFQPIVDIRKKVIFAYEALMRPNSDVLMRPDELIRVATAQSKLGQIEALTWHHAMKTFSEKCRESHVKLFINSMPDQCLSEHEVKQLEKNYSSLLSRLVIEVSEMTLSNPEYEQIKQGWCKKWGAQMALDDYGSGYSNPEFLVSRDFEYVKLDRGLIQDIHKSSSRQKLVTGIIEFCHENHMRIIAEGVETAEEFAEVSRLNCDYVQGYYLAKPKPEMIGMTERMAKKL